MSGSPNANLMVPVVVDALALGVKPEWATLAPDFARNYANGAVLGRQQLPASLWSFTSPGCPYGTGVHLRWALPDGLTKGQVDGSGSPSPTSPADGGSPEYPAVPNRWLVVRMIATSESPPLLTPAVSAWIVESDATTLQKPTSVAAAAQWPVFPSPGATLDPSDAVRYVGQVAALGASTGAGSYLDEPLTALGYGDPSFAAFYPMSNGVFGFHDSLDAFASSDPVYLTYFVAGWYDEASQDPLYGQDTPDAWVATMADLEWTWPGAGTGSPDSPTSASPADQPLPDPLPTRTLYHGMAARVCWQGPSFDYNDEVVPPPSGIQVAVGNTSIAALAALVAKNVHANNPQQDVSTIEDLLIAFQTDLLTAYEGGQAQSTVDAELDQQLHSGAFGSKPGGVTWEIRLKEGAQHESGLPGQGETPPAVPLPVPIGSLLTELNTLQREYDAGTRVLTSLQQRYFQAWYKTVEGLAVSPDVLSDLESEIDAQNAALAALAEQIDGGSPSAVATLRTALGELLPTYELRHVPAARFWQQQEPVIIVSGAGRALQHGEDGRFEQGSDGLSCRPSAGTVTGLPPTLTEMFVTPEGMNQLTFKTSFFQIDLPASGGAIPADLEADLQLLLLEAALLDPNQAGPLAAYVGQGEPAVVDAIRAQQEIAWNAATTTSDPDDFFGTAPSEAAVTWWLTWKGVAGNPWIPIFLQWQADWQSSYPSYDGVPDALEGWRFNGRDFNTPGVSTGAPAIVLDGVNLLTPSPVWHLQQQLLQYLESQPPPSSPNSDEAILKEIYGELSSLHILAQGAGGLHQQVAMRLAELQLPPIHVDYTDVKYSLATPVGSPAQPLTEYLSGNYHVSPTPSAAAPQDPATETPIFPIRAGGVALSRLALVDAYGQVLDLDPPPDLILGPTLRPDDESPGFSGAQLTPRIAQRARLNFRWVSADDPTIESNSDPATSPVIGWVWANELDRSLMLSNAQGALLGKFRASADGSTVLWVDDPKVSSGAVGSPDGSPWISPAAQTSPAVNPELEQFSQALLAQTGADFLDFLSYLMETQDQITPPGSQATSAATLLMGAPIALARASLSLELDGLPVFDQSSDALGEFNDRGFTEVPFNVTLGDLQLPGDGLYGYFRTDSGSPGDYDTFYAAFGETAGLAGSYVVAPDTNASPVRLTAQPSGSPATGALVTLLLDARCPVRAQTGILPSKSIQLPSQDISAVLGSHEIFFQVAPVLTSAGDFAIPRPSQDYGTWSWLDRTGSYPSGGSAATSPTSSPGSWQSQWQERTGFGQQTGLSGQPAYPLALLDGWLRLATPGSAAAAILYFNVLGGLSLVPKGATVELAWGATVPDGYQLTLGTGSSGAVVEPVVTSFSQTLSADTTFELTLRDGDGSVVDSSSLTVRVDDSS